MLKLVFASIRKRKVRFALITLAVASGVGLYFGSLLLVKSLEAEALKLAYEGVEVEAKELWSAQKTDFVILEDRQDSYEQETRDESDEDVRLDETVLPKLRETGLQIEAAAEFVETTQNTAVLKGERVLSSYNDLYVAYSEEADFNDFLISEGEPPLEVGQIALSEELASEYYVELGETVTLKYKETETSEEGLEEEVALRVRDFEIVGFAVPRFRNTDKEAVGKVPSYITVVPIEDLRYLLGYEKNQLSRISIKAESADIQALREELPEGLRVQTSKEYFTGLSFPRDLLNEVDDFSGALNGLVQITVVIAVFMIFNVLNIVLQQRTTELALLRALSFSRLRIFRLILMESLVIALTATVVGLILGAAGGLFFTRFGGLLFENAPESVQLVWDWKALIWPTLLGMIVTLVASLLPAWQVSRLRPAAVLAGRHARSKSFKLRLIFGLILLGLGAALIISFLAEHRANLSSELEAVLLQFNRFVYGTLLTLAGVFVLMPIILHYLFRASGWFLRPLAGSGFSLILGNLGRQVRYSAVNVNMLIIITALMIGTLVTLQSMLIFNRHNLFEIFVNDWALPGGYEKEEGRGYIPDEALEELATSDAITNFNRIRHIDMIETTTEPLEEPSDYRWGDNGLAMQTIDTETFRGFFKFHSEIELIGENGLEALADGKVLVNGDTLRRYDWQEDQTIELIFENGTSSEYVIGGELKVDEANISSSYYDFLLDNEFHAQQLDSWPINFVSFDTADDYSDQDVTKIIEDIQRRHHRPFLRTDLVFTPAFSEDVQQSVDSGIQEDIRSLGNYFILPFVVALFGMACTLSLVISERRREIGILRALGFRRGEIRAGVCWEIVIVVLIGILIGGPLGILFSWMFQLLIESIVGVKFFSGAFTMPWLWFGIYGLAGIILAIVAGLWPAFRASRLNIVQAINDRL